MEQMRRIELPSGAWKALILPLNYICKSSRQYKLLKNKKNVSLLRKYSNDIDWWVYTKRSKNGHLIDILPFNLLTLINII